MTATTGLGDKRGAVLRRLPSLIFLDTNIVQNLQSFGEVIYDNYLAPETELKLEKLGPRTTEDIYALWDFMALGRRNGWPIAVSQRTLEELEATPRPGKHSELSMWGNELAYYFRSNAGEILNKVERSSSIELAHITSLNSSSLNEVLRVLPQEADRRLIVDALKYGCDVFLTMDYKTVWRYRDEVGQLEIQVMRPSELLEHISPWAGLFC